MAQLTDIQVFFLAPFHCQIINKQTKSALCIHAFVKTCNSRTPSSIISHGRKSNKKEEKKKTEEIIDGMARVHESPIKNNWIKIMQFCLIVNIRSINVQWLNAFISSFFRIFIIVVGLFSYWFTHDSSFQVFWLSMSGKNAFNQIQYTF